MARTDCGPIAMGKRSRFGKVRKAHSGGRPAVSKDGANVAFALRRNGKEQMHVMAGGRNATPSSFGRRRCSRHGLLVSRWQMDCRGGQRPQRVRACSKLPVDGGSPVRLATGPFLDPVWSPRGDLIVYGGYASVHAGAAAGECARMARPRSCRKSTCSAKGSGRGSCQMAPVWFTCWEIRGRSRISGCWILPRCALGV